MKTGIHQKKTHRNRNKRSLVEGRKPGQGPATMGRPKTIEGEKRTLHALLGAEDDAKWRAVVEAIRREKDMADLSESDCVRIVVREAYAARGLGRAPASEPLADSHPTPLPHTPQAATTRSRTGRTEPPAPESAHHRRVAPPASSRRGPK
jgi:hypothetical protein